ncbi:MAG: hypothetical protein ACXW2L_20375 [Burkholderiales bacterium]
MNRLLRAAAVAAMIVFAPMCGAQVLAGGLMTSESHAVLTLLSVDPVSHTAVLGGGDGWSLTVEMLPDQIQTSR